MYVKLGNPSRKNKAETIDIHNYDTWNMDITLAYIIVPMLKQLKEVKHGAPFVDNEDVSDELRTYKREIDNPDYVERSNQIASFIDRLYGINGQLWDTEKDIRNGVDMPLKEVGRLALKVRDLNCKRNEIKGEVVDAFSEGFKEIKINYKKIDYGKK